MIAQDYIFSFDYIKLNEKTEKEGIKNEIMNEKKNELKSVSDSFNEITISEKIKKLTDWEKYTNPILYSAPVKNMGKILLVKKKMDVSLLSFFQFREMRENKGDDKETIVQLVAIYNSLLKVLEWTGEQGLVSLSCELDKIVLDDKGRAKLDDFSNSFFIGDVFRVEILTPFVHLDLHVLYYVNLLGPNESLSSNNIHELCTHFIKGLNNIGIDLFTADFLQEYESKCIFSLHKLINMKKERIILELLKGSSYWDHFSMSLMFLILNISIFELQMLNNIMNSTKNSDLNFC